MKEVMVSRCSLCPVYQPDPSGFDHRAECGLDTELIPKRHKVPEACPLREGPIMLRLRDSSLDKA